MISGLSNLVNKSKNAPLSSIVSEHGKTPSLVSRHVLHHPLQVEGNIPFMVEKYVSKLEHFRKGNIQLWRGHAEANRSYCTALSAETLIMSICPLSVLSKGRNFTPFIKVIESVVVSLSHHPFDLEEWQSYSLPLKPETVPSL